MISTAYNYPYPVNDTSSARRAARQPYIYSPSESHNSTRNTMYPHLHPSGSPPPSYVYSGYEQYYSEPKDAWVAATPGSWPSYYPIPLRSSSHPQTDVNPKVTVLTPQPMLMSDIDTPSSISSHSVLTPSSPFAQHDVAELGFQGMDFDELDGDDEEDFIDSDFTDEMEGIDETEQGLSPLYGASEPHVIKSTSALEGALGDTPLSSYGTHLGVFAPADRRLSASVPGYPSASHRATATTHQRWSEKMHSPAPEPSSLPLPIPDVSYPSHHTYTHRNDSSTSLFAPPSSSLYNHISSSSSLAGAFAAPDLSPHASRPTSHPLPILQPQPIRPIPPIPLADLTATACESSTPESPRKRLRTLSPLPLLCQPVSDAIRYRLREPSVSGALDDPCYDAETASESMREDLVMASENDQFARQGSVFCPEHPSGGTCAVERKLYVCGCMDLPIRWR